MKPRLTHLGPEINPPMTQIRTSIHTVEQLQTPNGNQPSRKERSMVDPLPEQENSLWRRMMMDPRCRAAAS